MMKKTVQCNCKSGCTNRRCACLKANEPCDENCDCIDCKNPLNDINVENLSVCTIQNIDRYQSLSEKELEKEYELPCGCEKIPLKKLLGNYECAECGELYWFSFCWDTVVQDGDTWHCERCGTCRDWREWHCENCDRCTYGISLPCENCGRKHEMAKFF